ncbi:universal stress protein [Parasulfitobacter algicola]|uniref:Universal stress protein n=1 Tax=Parasulfitobacter algicola TaxID=2614809 RepID=A0ABX2IV06_9RHOB|nr:universal stress protein [Sulfitobacter algicola]NSX54880.1 universal stress protein [Sulfitobacter algicola]
MALKTILTVLTDTELSKDSLTRAAALAQAQDAHLDVLALGVDTTQVGYYYAGATAVVQQITLENADNAAKKIADFAEQQLAGTIVRYGIEVAASQLTGMSPLVAQRARFADIVVLPRPYGENCGIEMETLVEIALFEGQASVLIIPQGDTSDAFPKRVVVGWNESRESLAAIRRALPFLVQAEKVSVAVIDPPQHGPNRSDPGGMLSQYLARHGVSVEVCVISKTLPRVSDQLQRHALDIDADMLVMGAYGHSRFRQAILGGATRNTLEGSKIPVFMAH